jgi:hypothetical protein
MAAFQTPSRARRIHDPGDLYEIIALRQVA